MDIVLIIAVIIVLSIYSVIWQNKQIAKTKAIGEEKFKSFLDEQNFKVNKSIDIQTFANSMEINTNQLTKFLVDDVNKKFAIISYNLTIDKIEFKEVKYTDLINFNLFEDGEQQIQGKGMIATSGALLFGVAGAVVGSVAGNTKIKNKCSELSVRLQINDLQSPLISLVLLSNTDKNSIFYRLSKQKADDIIATLTYIENNK